MVIIKELQEKLKVADPSFRPQNYEAIGAVDSSNMTALPTLNAATAPTVAASQAIEMKPFVRKGMLVKQGSNSPQLNDEDIFGGGSNSPIASTG